MVVGTAVCHQPVGSKLTDVLLCDVRLSLT